MKHCPQCNRDLPESAFGLDNRRADKLHPWCKECKNRKGREQYAASPEVRATRAKSRDAWLAIPGNREKMNAKQRIWRAEHMEDPEYRASEKERTSWANRTPEQKRRKAEIYRVWCGINREHLNRRHREYVKERYKNDPEFKADLRSYFVRYRNAKRANGGSFTAEEWSTMCLLSGGRCVKCGQIAKLEVDHIIPVTKGGSNDIDNIQPLCRSCNASKGATEMDYRPLTLIGSMSLEMGA